MAIISLAAPVSGIRGKVGGVIYSQNGSGPYLKAWARGSNPRTLTQSNHRANLVSFSQTWKTLTAGQRSGWDTYAALAAQELFNSLGESYYISGFLWFIRLNLNGLSAGDSLFTTAPVSGIPATPIIEEVFAFPTDDAGITNIELQAGSPGLGERLVIKAELLNSVGRLVLAEVRTFMLTQELDIAVVNIPFKTELLEHFGTAQVGQKLFCTIQHQSDEGRRSAPASGSVAVIETVSAQFFNATFTVGVNTDVTAYTPDLGTSFTDVFESGPGELRILDADDNVSYNGAATGSGSFVTADVTYPSADYFVQATLVTGYMGDDTITLFLRYADNNNNYYVSFSSTTLTRCVLYKRIAGVSSPLANLSQVIADGSIVKFSIVGNDMKVYDDGLLIGSITNTQLPTAGKGGFGFGSPFGANSDDLYSQELDNFEIWSI